MKLRISHLMFALIPVAIVVRSSIRFFRHPVEVGNGDIAVLAICLVVLVLVPILAAIEAILRHRGG